MVDAAFTVAASLLLVVGWLITSAAAARLFAGSLLARVLATGGVLSAAVIYAATTRGLEAMSQRAAASLDGVKYVPAAYYRDRVLRPHATSAFVRANVLLDAFATALVWLIAPGRGKPRADGTPLGQVVLGQVVLGRAVLGQVA